MAGVKETSTMESDDIGEATVQDKARKRIGISGYGGRQRDKHEGG